MGESFYFGDLMFQIVPLFIGLIFIIVIGSILVSIFKGIGTWKKNEQSPRLSVPATIVSRRTHVSRRGGDLNDNHISTTYSTYFVTFEFESGDRSEFKISGKEYGLLAEGDYGILTFQRTRFLNFNRNQEQIN